MVEELNNYIKNDIIIRILDNKESIENKAFRDAINSLKKDVQWDLQTMIENNSIAIAKIVLNKTSRANIKMNIICYYTFRNINYF